MAELESLSGGPVEGWMDSWDKEGIRGWDAEPGLESCRIDMSMQQHMAVLVGLISSRR
jgi:hypothetical protein